MSFKIEFNQDFYWRLFTVLCVAAVILVSSDAAFASGNDVVGDTLCRLTQNLTGNMAKAIATIAIFAVGVSLFMGKLNWGTAAMTAGGVGIIFGSAQLVNWLAGTASGSACNTSD